MLNNAIEYQVQLVIKFVRSVGRSAVCLCFKPYPGNNRTAWVGY